MHSRLIKALALSIAAIGIAPSAFAVLDRAGPVDAVNGFPQWYSDKNGVALEMCINIDPAVLAAGGCAILPAAPPDGVLTVPEVFPTNWATEHFYTLASVKLPATGLDKLTRTPVSGAGNIVFNMGLEGSFATGVPTPGTQITFNRWRVTHTNVGCTGKYTYYTPNNPPQTYDGAEGGKIFETSDVGIGTFTGPLAGSTGPFLQWSDVPGGAVKAPFIGPDGKKYISDYNAVGTPVTGSDLANPLLASTKAWIPAAIKAMKFANYVLVEGPGIATGNCALTESVSTTTGFNLFGRYYEGVLPSVNQVERATYKAVASVAGGVPDGFQVGVWATVAQKVTGLVPTLGMSLFSGDPVAPTSQTLELAMTRQPLPTSPGTQPKFEFFQGTPAAKQVGTGVDLSRPAATHARARITSDAPATVMDLPLVDELRISEALWDSVAKTLTVTAESGALLVAPTPATQTAANADCSVPCLKIDPFGLPAFAVDGTTPTNFKLNTFAGEKFAVMSTVIQNVHVPPAYITVLSSNGGRDTQPVIYAGSATGAAILQPDLVSTPLNTAVTIPVLANDIGVSAPPALLICTAATGGTCGVPAPAATCVANTASTSCTTSGGRLALTADNQVVYTPRANLGGLAESFFYQANTVAGAARAQVTVNVGSLGGLPDARDDLGLSSVAGTAASFSVIANDFALAGIDLATLRITQTPCNLTLGVCDAATATFNAAGRLLFNATSGGNWSMAYTFNDRNGVLADPGVVTVNVLAGEALVATRFLWSPPKKAGLLGTVQGNGTSTVNLGQVINLYLPNAATGPNGCDFPLLGTRIASTTVVAGPPPAWVMGATALTTRPSQVYAYSPTYKACVQGTVR